jgi:hypothetical protein
MVMGAGHDLDRVKLNEAKRVDHRGQIKWTGGRRPQALRVQPEPPCAAVVDLELSQ